MVLFHEVFLQKQFIRTLHFQIDDSFTYPKTGEIEKVKQVEIVNGTENLLDFLNNVFKNQRKKNILGFT